MIKTLEITDINVFAELYEINLNKQPNQEFTTTINDNIYQFEINTFIDEKTFIKIKKDSEVLGQGFIKIGIDFAYNSQNEKGQFFFLKKINSNMINFNYSDFGENIGLFYGVLSENANDYQKLSDEYSVKYANQDLAVW